MSHKKFVTTSRGLQRTSPPMRLFEKAKRLGIWNPSEIDLNQDQKDWITLSAEEKDLILFETDYGGRFVSGIRRGKCYATQFHPEKSQAKGLQLYRNFLNLL